MLFKIKVIIFFLLMANIASATLVDVSKTSILVKETNPNNPLLLKQAFAQIIANNSGEPILAILQNPQINQSNIKSGIKRSYFEKVESKYLTNKQENYFWFHVVMDENFIKQTIKNAGLSLLPHNRQEIVLWAVKEEELPIAAPIELASDEISIPPRHNQAARNEPLIQYAYDDELFNYWFDRWAESLGMVFIKPAIDEQDMLIVTPESIQNVSYAAHQQTQLKFDRNLSLLLYFKRTEQEIKYRTGTYIEDESVLIQHFQQPGSEEGEIIYSVVADMAEKYANTFKISAYEVESHTVQMVINNIGGFDDINTIKKYLTELSVIESFQIVSANTGRLVIVADLTVSSDSFLNLINRQNLLHHNQNGSINQLIFNFINKLD